MLSTALIGRFVRFLNLQIDEKLTIWPMTLAIFIFDEKLEIRQSAAVPKNLNISFFRYDVKYRFNQ
jgi:hypothetical protein